MQQIPYTAFLLGGVNEQKGRPGFIEAMVILSPNLHFPKNFMQSFSYSFFLNELQNLEIKRKKKYLPPKNPNYFSHSCVRLTDLNDLPSLGKYLFP